MKAIRETRERICLDSSWILAPNSSLKTPHPGRSQRRPQSVDVGLVACFDYTADLHRGDRGLAKGAIVIDLFNARAGDAIT